MIELELGDPYVFWGSKTNLVYVPMRNGIALREKNTPVIYVWRLPSLVCEHISYAAWCFSVTCFLQYKPNKSLADKWHWKFDLPSFVFSLVIDFLSLFFLRPTWMVYHTEKRDSVLEAGDANGMVDWPIDLCEWHWPHIYLSIYW